MPNPDINIDPLKTPKKIKDLINQVRSVLGDVSPLAAVLTLHTTLKVGGQLGLKYIKETDVPKTPEQVLESGGGDCSEFAFLFLSTLLELGIDKLNNVKLGAIIVHFVGDRSDVDHAVPLILVKGEIPQGIHMSDILEKDEELRKQASKLFGIPAKNLKNWKLIIADLQKKELGLTGKFDQVTLTTLAGARADYFTEWANKIQGFELEEKLYLRALKFDPNNFFSLKNLGILYFNNGLVEKAIPYFEKLVGLGHTEEKKQLIDCHILFAEQLAKEGS